MYFGASGFIVTVNQFPFYFGIHEVCVKPTSVSCALIRKGIEVELVLGLASCDKEHTVSFLHCLGRTKRHTNHSQVLNVAELIKCTKKDSAFLYGL